MRDCQSLIAYTAQLAHLCESIRVLSRESCYAMFVSLLKISDGGGIGVETSYDRRSLVDMQLSIRGATYFLLIHAVSSATTGLTKDAEITLLQDESLNITNSTLAADVLSHFDYKGLTSQPSPLLNTTVPSIPNSNATSLEGLHVVCEGHNILQSSCFDAINTFGPQSPRYLSVGERVPGMLSYDLNLPVRWISGTFAKPLHETST